MTPDQWLAPRSRHSGPVALPARASCAWDRAINTATPRTACTSIASATIDWARSTGKHISRALLRGRVWRPLSPLSARREGEAIRVDFYVPVPPLVWDESCLPPRPSRPEWAAGRGFELFSHERPLTIAAVEIRADSVLIHLPRRTAWATARALCCDGRAGRPPARHAFAGGNCATRIRSLVHARAPLQPNYAVTFELEVP